jgi:hypothetical protein
MEIRHRGNSPLSIDSVHQGFGGPSAVVGNGVEGSLAGRMSRANTAVVLMPAGSTTPRHRPPPAIWPGIVLAAVSALTAVTAIWGLSYPGFPMASAALLLLNAVVLVLLWVRWGKRVVRWRTGWVLPVTGIILIGGIVMATSTRDAQLHARWAASDAVTDSSGIAYLPNRNQPEATGLHPDGLIALGGP